VFQEAFVYATEGLSQLTVVPDTKHKVQISRKEVGHTVRGFAAAYRVLFISALNEGDIFLGNVGLSPNYAALQPRRPYTS
jgi:hypothetical protein